MPAAAPARVTISLTGSTADIIPRARSAIRLLLTGLLLASPLSACVMTPRAAVFDADSQAAMTRLSDYLDGLQHFQADFSQNGPDGQAMGIVWISRPGFLRVEYYRPGPKTMLAARGRLLIADHLTGATTTLPVARTPLDILLASSIRFTGPVTVTAFEHHPDRLRISLAKTGAPGQGTLTLDFTDHPLALTSVTIDRQGQLTQLDLAHLVRDPDFGPDRFIYHPDPQHTGS